MELKTFEMKSILTILILLSSTSLLTLAAPIFEIGERQETLSTIPGPPTDPKQLAGDGAGVYNSLAPTQEDYKVLEACQSMVTWADRLGLENAAHNMDHYLKKSGSDLKIPPDNMMDTMMFFKREVRAKAEEYAQKAFTKSRNNQLSKQTFVSPWTDYYANILTNEDWFYSLGGFRYSVAGALKVQKSGTDYTAELEWLVYVFDRYNWDAGKATTLPKWPIIFFDEDIGRLHLTGLAKEYVVRGESEKFVVHSWDGGKLPAPVLHPTDYQFVEEVELIA